MRELSAWLKQLSEPDLAALADLRPDVGPVTTDRVAMPQRLLDPQSLAAAVAGLDLFAYQLLEVCHAVADERRLHRRDVTAAVGDLATAAQLDDGLARLQSRALLWPDGAALRLPELTWALGYRPLGLGKPLRDRLAKVNASSVRLVAATLGLGHVHSRTAALDLIVPHHSDAATVRSLLDSAPEPARDLLLRIDAGAGAARDPAGPSYGGARRRSRVEALEWLVDRALLVPADWGVLEVPREVGAALRGGRLVRRLDPERPAVPAVPAPPAADVDRVAAGAAERLLDAATLLCETVDAAPLTRLKDGGIGLREVRRLGAAVDRDERGVIGLLTLLAAAGLLDPGSQVRLDRSYDRWVAGAPADRYAALVAAWLRLEQPLTADKPDGKPFPALVPLTFDVGVPLGELKQALLTELDGIAPDAEALVRRLTWDCPALMAGGAQDLLHGVRTEAELLGILALGTLTSAGRAALADAGRADLGVSDWFPPVVEELVLQADLTAIVPGPPTASLRSLLDAAADRESRGGASTWRFSPGSVRRALDGGLPADELLERLAAAARRGVPQTLEYLVRDTARQHGRIRIGSAGCYLRCADAALAAEIAGTRALAGLGLRELAPAVLVADADPETVLLQLQRAGYAPVVEDAAGQAVVRRLGGQRGKGGRRLAGQLARPA